MEVQVNVAQDNGQKTKYTYRGKTRYCFTDGVETWRPIRIPYNADTDPSYEDSPLGFNFEKHVEGIGLTGWNWKQKQSHWFGYDVDSIINHKEGLTEQEIEDITNKVMDIPYITVVRSTSGRGIHLYIHLDKPFPTQTHTEHAAVARSLLSIMSIDAGFNFSNSVDVCGMVLWVWHRKANNSRESFKLLKLGQKLARDKIPSNWRIHLDVTSGKRRKTATPSPTGDDIQFQIMTSATRKTVLDDKHKSLLDWFKSSAEKEWWWDNDHNMLVCHTLDLKRAHSTLGLAGVFYTSSSGSSEQNCFAFPSEEGSWIVRRHTRGVKEHPSWSVDPSGWTRCNFNCPSDLGTCVRANGGLENAVGDYVFATMREGLQALEDLGITDVSDILKPVPIYEQILSKRQFIIKPKKENKVILMFERIEETDKEFNIRGFTTNKKGDRWEKVIVIPYIKKIFSLPDHIVRHVVTKNIEAGWYIQTKKGWVSQQRCNVITVLQSQTMSVSKMDVEIMMSKAVLDPWELVNIPFAEEYPGNRQWNMNAAAFSCEPRDGACDAWFQILEHLGQNIDEDVAQNTWCTDHNISTGKDYLFYWIANMFQRPEEPLPYLFFVGPQNCGKSTLHEALGLLMLRGYVRADNALSNASGFNAEVANAVLCVVEETDLGKNSDALNRIKDWVTGRHISIRALYHNAYDMINTSHWIQCANSVKNCPILPGDTRIVPINVSLPEREIPKKTLFEILEKEKRAFLNQCLTVTLPEPVGRLSMPCIQTSHKTVMEDKSNNDLMVFLKERTKIQRGAAILFNDFYSEFYDWLEPDQKQYWTKHRVSKLYPTDKPYCKGRAGGSGNICLGNITFDLECSEPETEECFTDLTGRLRKRVWTKN